MPLDYSSVLSRALFLVYGQSVRRKAKAENRRRQIGICHPILEYAAVGSQRSVSQPQSVLTLTPNSKAICFRVFRNFNLFCFIFWPSVTGASCVKKATHDVSLPLGFPGVRPVNGS